MTHSLCDRPDEREHEFYSAAGACGIYADEAGGMYEVAEGALESARHWLAHGELEQAAAYVTQARRAAYGVGEALAWCEGYRRCVETASMLGEIDAAIAQLSIDHVLYARGKEAAARALLCEIGAVVLMLDRERRLQETRALCDA